MAKKYGTVNLSQRDPTIIKHGQMTWVQKKEKNFYRKLKKTIPPILAPNRSTDPVQRQINTNEYRLKKYNLTEEGYNKILRYQCYECAICGRIPRLPLKVDHDHHTSFVRGLLCGKCNTSRVGSNTASSIQRVVAYLTNPPADKALNEQLNDGDKESA